MAKPMKKKVVKAAASKTQKKKVAKAPAKKAAPKAAVKSASKAAAKKKTAKAATPPAKAKKAVAAPAKKVEAKKTAAAAQKKATAPAKEKDAKRNSPAPEKVSAASAKKDLKAGKKGKGKKEETELEDDFVPDDDLGHDEIGEYAEELKAVESLDEESDDETDDFAETEKNGDEEIYLTDAEGRRYCRARDCDQIAIVDAYCRYHYLLFWKKIQVRKKILVDGKLEKYIEELTSRYPDKFLEMIRRDLRTEKDFLAAIQELEIDESTNENEFEEDTQYIEEVRGMGEGSASGVEDEEF